MSKAFQRAPRPAGAPVANPSTATRTPAQQGERLSKRVMQIKACSRREAEQYIEAGWVRVDGQVVEEPAFRVQQQQVALDAQATLLGLESVSLIVHKPPGIPDGSKSALALLTPEAHCPHDPDNRALLKAHLRNQEALVPLETGASGLLVFSQDWRVRRKLLEDLGSMEHELVADVAGEVSDEALQKLARLFKDERLALPATKFSINSSQPERSKLRFAIKGAHPGLIAFVCEKAGLDLLALRRIRLGRVALSDLPVGQWRYLAAYEKF